jgi:hypothetical protein
VEPEHLHGVPVFARLTFDLGPTPAERYARWWAGVVGTGLSGILKEVYQPEEEKTDARE